MTGSALKYLARSSDTKHAVSVARQAINDWLCSQILFRSSSSVHTLQLSSGTRLYKVNRYNRKQHGFDYFCYCRLRLSLLLQTSSVSLTVDLGYFSYCRLGLFLFQLFLLMQTGCFSYCRPAVSLIVNFGCFSYCRLGLFLLLQTGCFSYCRLGLFLLLQAWVVSLTVGFGCFS